jgi:general secretion pathway protein A
VYKSFFKLKKNPFNVNPDPAYLYLTPAMGRALDELTYGIETRKGLMLLTGEAGTGKTTLMNHLLLWLEHKSSHTAFIFNSHLDREQLFDFMLADFEIRLTPHAKANPLLAFNEWLLARYRARDLVVLIVDEAQGLPVHVLEEIRMLSNMETPNEKLLQIILAGQPELEVKLKRPDLRQLQQRIGLRCKTAPLSLQETKAYIEDRLHTAGSTLETVFTLEAVESIYSYSRGIPRVINLLCETALVSAYAEGEQPISARIIDEGAQDLQFDEVRPAAPRLHTVGQQSETPDLHAILAKIRAEADRQHGHSSAQRPVPYVVGSEKSEDRDSRRVMAFKNELEAAGEHSLVESFSKTVLENVPEPGTSRRMTEMPLRVWKKRRESGYLQMKLAELGSRAEILRLRAALRAVVAEMREWQLTHRIRGFVHDAWLRVEPGISRTRRTVVPRVKGGFGSATMAVKEFVVRARQWAEPRVIAFSRTVGPQVKAGIRNGKESVHRLAARVREIAEPRVVAFSKAVGPPVKAGIRHGRESAQRMTDRVREVAESRVVAFSKAVGPQVKAGVTGLRASLSAARARLWSWLGQHFNEETYGTSLAASVAALVILYVMVRWMSPVQGWQHPGWMILGFAVLMLCAVVSALGIVILVRARRRLRQDSSQLVSSTVRWLRAPIQPMQVRNMQSLDNKAQSQRRAS